MAITDFLATKRTKDELKTTLDVLREFKACESDIEYLAVPFAAWAKFEQLEEFLDHRVNGTDLQDDTKKYMEEHPLP